MKEEEIKRKLFRDKHRIGKTKIAKRKPLVKQLN